MPTLLYHWPHPTLQPTSRQVLAFKIIALTVRIAVRAATLEIVVELHSLRCAPVAAGELALYCRDNVALERKSETQRGRTVQQLAEFAGLPSRLATQALLQLRTLPFESVGPRKGSGHSGLRSFLQSADGHELETLMAMGTLVPSTADTSYL
jgi:hypothetical protein